MAYSIDTVLDLLLYDNYSHEIQLQLLKAIVIMHIQSMAHHTVYVRVLNQLKT